MEPQKEFTQEEVDRLIQLRKEIDGVIKKAQAYLCPKPIGSNEDKKAEYEPPMKVKEFIELCKKYIPECIMKDEGTCGWICFRGGTEPYNAIVALLPRGEYAVYDQWRDCTITKDKEYMLNFLKKKATVKVKE